MASISDRLFQLIAGPNLLIYKLENVYRRVVYYKVEMICFCKQAIHEVGLSNQTQRVKRLG